MGYVKVCANLDILQILLVKLLNSLEDKYLKPDFHTSNSVLMEKNVAA